MRWLLVLLVGCSSSESTPQTPADAGDETIDVAIDTAPVDKCATMMCGAPGVCDKLDGRCKAARFPKLGQPCGGAAGACSGPPGATCLEGAFPDGYCSIMPCGVDDPCPVGAICANIGGKQACFATCNIDGDCRGGVEYKCHDLSQLIVSGGARKACYPTVIACKTDADCPKPFTCKDGMACSAPS